MTIEICLLNLYKSNSTTVPNIKQITDSHLRNKHVQNTNQSGYHVQIVQSVIEVTTLRGLYQQKAQLQCSPLATVKLLTLLMGSDAQNVSFFKTIITFCYTIKAKQQDVQEIYLSELIGNMCTFVKICVFVFL